MTKENTNDLKMLTPKQIEIILDVLFEQKPKIDDIEAIIQEIDERICATVAFKNVRDNDDNN